MANWYTNSSWHKIVGLEIENGPRLSSCVRCRPIKFHILKFLINKRPIITIFSSMCKLWKLWLHHPSNTRSHGWVQTANMAIFISWKSIQSFYFFSQRYNSGREIKCMVKKIHEILFRNCEIYGSQSGFKHLCGTKLFLRDDFNSYPRKRKLFLPVL